MKKSVILFVFVAIFVLLFSQTAFANTYGCIRTNGYIISENNYQKTDVCLLTDSGKSVVTSDGEIYFSTGNTLFIKNRTVFSIDDGFSVFVGAIGITTGESEMEIHTGTEKAVIAKNSQVAIRVDDYGNTFNYCVNGSVELVSIKDNQKISLSEGEYIAVTVKRGIRILKQTSKEDVEKLGIYFAETKGVIADQNKSLAIETIKTDFSEGKVLAKVQMNKVYKIESLIDNFAQDLYLDCDANVANITIFNENFDVVAESRNVAGSLKPNVSVSNQNGKTFYILFEAVNNEEIDFCHNSSETVFTRMFALLKKIALPAVIALVIFAVFYLILNKKKKKVF